MSERPNWLHAPTQSRHAVTSSEMQFGILLEGLGIHFQGPCLSHDTQLQAVKCSLEFFWKDLAFTSKGHASFMKNNYKQWNAVWNSFGRIWNSLPRAMPQSWHAVTSSEMQFGILLEGFGIHFQRPCLSHDTQLQAVTCNLEFCWKALEFTSKGHSSVMTRNYKQWNVVWNSVGGRPFAQWKIYECRTMGK